MIGAVLVVVLTSPTVTRATSVGRLDTDDGKFGIWNIAWVDHALLTQPSQLLDANIFWPHTGTLAYSELNLVAGALGLPWYAATHSALAALNGAVATGLLLSFVFTWALVRRLTGSDGAGLVAATGYTFCPNMTARTAEIQLLMIFVFPMVLLAFHRWLERPTLWRAGVLGASLAIASLACGYYGIFAGCALAAATLVFARADRRYWLGLIVAAGVACALIYPVYRAFTAARIASGSDFLNRSSQAGDWSARLSDYLASSAIAHEWWLPYVGWSRDGDVLFPGIGVFVLAVVGIAAARRFGARRVVAAYLVIAALSFWASFGPQAGLYRALETVIPGMTLLRAPSRFGIVVTFALAVIAGFGVAKLEQRRRWLPLVLVLVLACELSVKTAEFGWPSWPLREVPPVSPAYRMLATLPRAPMVEYPFPYKREVFHTAGWAMFWSTYHWLPMVNGYSDVIPPDAYEIALPINGFPDAASFEIMKARGVRYVLWHIDTYDENSLRVLTERFGPYDGYLRPLLKTADVWLYEITRYP